MKSKEEMAQFFNNIKNYVKRNRIFEISEKNIYDCLIYYGCKEDYRMEDKIDRECKQICEYAKQKNTKIIFKEQGHSPKKFTHVVFNLDGAEDYTKVFKLYIPIKYEKVPEVLEQIYAYLIENNIRCETKISSSDRSDNFVVRLYDSKDIDSFLQFCNDNSIIKNNIKRTNPFVATKNNIGIVQDGGIKESFNGALASLLTGFINACIKFDEIDMMNISGFQQYLIEKLNEEISEEIKFTYSCVFNSINQIVEQLDPVSEIKENIYKNPYKF